MLENISSVLAQVDGLVVVDNGSAADAVAMLRMISNRLGFHLIENNENLGVAEALNQGVRWAKSRGYAWVILFDQDSKLTDNFMRDMFSTWESHPERKRVVSIHPRYVDPKKGTEPEVRRAPDGGPFVSFTSGALMPEWIFDKLGWFASEYFIDFVDWEYCLRARSAGYLVIDSRQAALLHVPGSPAEATLLGHSFYPSHKSPMRRYYISRNCIPFYKKYFRSFPAWVLKGIYGQFKDTIVCLLAEADRKHKLRNILLGTWDGLTGRMGRRDDL